MPEISVNGELIDYPDVGDVNWGTDATDFAIETSAALGKIGLSSGTTVDIPGTLDVTGATTLDSTLTVAGTANLNGNNNLGNASSDTTAITGILNVDSGVLYVDPATNKVGINDTTPSEALDVTGNALISGTLGVTGVITGASATLTDITVDTNLIKTISASNFVGINTTTPTVALDVTGNIKASSQIQIPDGTVSVPGISPSTEQSSGLYKIATNKLGIAINGNRVGEVGVGYGGFTGNIIQVVSSFKSDTSSFSSSWGDISGLSLSITPKYTSSKILLFASVLTGRSGDIMLFLKFVRNTTDIAMGDTPGNRTSTTSSNAFGSSSPTVHNVSQVMMFSDSPNTTSETTYKIQAKSDSGTGYINRTGNDSDIAVYPRSTSFIMAMELQQ